MKRSNRLVLLIGVFLAIVAFVGIVVVLGQPPSQGPAASAAQPVDTVTAAQDIPLGATLTQAMLTTTPIKPADRKAGAFGNPSQIVGQKVRRPITAGAQLSRSDFQDTTGTDDIVVPEGKRAISIQVNQVNGVGTLIKTGDYVDLVLGVTGDKFPVVTLNPDDDSITVVQGLNSTSVKLLIEGMQVIGTIRPPTTATKTTNAAPSGSAAQAPTTTLSDEGQELVILAVTAQQAELIKYAQIDGDISLLLRNSLDFLDAQGNPVVSLPAGTTGVILRTIVDNYGVLRPELVEAILPAQ